MFFQGGFCQSWILAVWRHTDLHEVAILASRFGFPAVEVEKVRTSLTKSQIYEKATWSVSRNLGTFLVVFFSFSKRSQQLFFRRFESIFVVGFREVLKPAGGFLPTSNSSSEIGGGVLFYGSAGSRPPALGPLGPGPGNESISHRMGKGRTSTQTVSEVGLLEQLQ